MKNLNLIFLLLVVPFWGISQTNDFELVDYVPAPGQHINIELIGTPQAALQMTSEVGKLVSLGSFGGYVVLKFSKACENDPQNPYGIDFNLFGNAFAGSSEPGVVWVMNDENQNGLPDDTWYEIAGSNYFHSKTQKNYAVTYFKTETRDVFWKDDSGKSGWLQANNFNTQEYYPLPGYFNDYLQDSVKFTGTLLSPAFDSSNTQDIKNEAFAFGYADNHPRKRGIDLSIPDNPYTQEAEGAGGDPIDISWAVDSLGDYVELNSIHFVKIVSGILSNVGRLGEISTDVAWLSDVKPGTEVSEKKVLLVVYNHPEKIVAGDTMLLEANYFEKGKISDENIMFSSRDESIAEIDENGIFTAKKKGEVEISISAGGEIKTETIRVAVPGSIEIISDFSSVYPGDSILLGAGIFDNENEPINIPVTFSSSHPDIAEVVQNGNQLWLLVHQPGHTELICSVNGFGLQKSVHVKVFSDNDKIKIYFTCKTADENLFPFQWIEVGPADLNNFVGERQQDYSGLNRLSLFHALAAGLNKAEVNFEFRDDEAAAGNLYLHSVEKDGLFTRGWGGKTDPEAFERGWIARLNKSPFLNSFNNIEISNGDTVDLYHVQDITSPWVYSRLLPDKDSATVNEEIELLLEQTNCTFSNGEITENKLEPVANAEIKLDDELYFTESNGKVNVLLETSPPVVFSSGNNAVFLAQKITTGAPVTLLNKLKIYPNPVNDLLKISNDEAGEISLKMTDLSGKILYKKVVLNSSVEIDMSAYSSGIYLLNILRKSQRETSKIIKK